MAINKRGSMAYEVERAMRIFTRKCLDCPDETPSCPPCSSNQICSLVPSDCNACAHMICVDNPNPGPSSSPGPNVGAIAGGVVGGIAFFAFVVFLVWRFWIKKRRAQQELEAEEWDEDEIAQQKAAFQNMQHDAASTRTRGSLANSLLSRASNVIQIAYIPGVTNRNGGSTHNSMLGASPVPPIPAARSTPRSPLSNNDGALFFRPSDIRDSSYSGTSTVDERRDTQYTRSSLAPSLARSSMTSGVYQDDATIEPMPITQISRAVPRMVSVKSTNATSPTESPNASSLSVNQGANSKQPVQILMPGTGERPSTSGSLRGKAQQITVGGANKVKGRFPIRTDVPSAAKHAPAVSSPLVEANNDTDDDEEEHARARRSLLKVATDPAGTPTSQPEESPFFDASERIPPGSITTMHPYASMASTVGSNSGEAPRSKGMGGLSAVIEEATRKASSPTPPKSTKSTKSTSSGSVKSVSGPFSDENKIQ